jgi:hypothetical protein
MTRPALDPEEYGVGLQRFYEDDAFTSAIYTANVA